VIAERGKCDFVSNKHPRPASANAVHADSKRLGNICSEA